MGDKTREQLLQELSEVQKELNEKPELQGQMVRQFQMLIADENLFSQIINSFPYPIAIFTPKYTLALMNNAFKNETKMRLMNHEKSAVHILQYKIDDVRLAAAVVRVFAGDTFFLEDLKKPFSMFSGISRQEMPQLARFSKAIVFPVPVDDAKTTYGVIMYIPRVN